MADSDAQTILRILVHYVTNDADLCTLLSKSALPLQQEQFIAMLNEQL